MNYLKESEERITPLPEASICIFCKYTFCLEQQEL